MEASGGIGRGRWRGAEDTEMRPAGEGWRPGRRGNIMSAVFAGLRLRKVVTSILIWLQLVGGRPQGLLGVV
ncbi:unnamed protein product, partial [Staurois parvus]